MRFSAGRHEPQFVPHFSAPCSCASCASAGPLQRSSCARMAGSPTLKQVQTCLPLTGTATGASYTAATFNGSGVVSLTTLLSHSLT